MIIAKATTTDFWPDFSVKTESIGFYPIVKLVWAGRLDSENVQCMVRMSGKE